MDIELNTITKTDVQPFAMPGTRGFVNVKSEVTHPRKYCLGTAIEIDPGDDEAAIFVMLRPCDAGHNACMRLAHRWGYDRLLCVYLYTPEVNSDDDMMDWLADDFESATYGARDGWASALEATGVVYAVWGNHNPGRSIVRHQQHIKALVETVCADRALWSVQLTRAGVPRQAPYIDIDTRPKLWVPKASDQIRLFQ